MNDNKANEMSLIVPRDKLHVYIEKVIRAGKGDERARQEAAEKWGQDFAIRAQRFPEFAFEELKAVARQAEPNSWLDIEAARQCDNLWPQVKEGWPVDVTHPWRNLLKETSNESHLGDKVVRLLLDYLDDEVLDKLDKLPPEVAVNSLMCSLTIAEEIHVHVLPESPHKKHAYWTWNKGMNEYADYAGVKRCRREARRRAVATVKKYGVEHPLGKLAKGHLDARRLSLKCNRERRAEEKSGPHRPGKHAKPANGKEMPEANLKDGPGS